MSSDIKNILSRLDQLSESALTPATVNKGLNSQQKSVPQLPALFKPHGISVLKNKTDPAHPAKKYFVGAEGKEQEVEEADQITIEPARATTQVIKQGNKVLGTVNNPQLAAVIKNAIGKGEMTLTGPLTKIPEAATTEDVLSTVKKKLGDYIQDVATAIKKDPDLIDKIPQDKDKIGPAVKTIRTDDGQEIKIHGTEDDGFRITIKNKAHSAKFESLDHAIMACEMYCNHRRNVSDNADYVEEKK